MKIHRSNSNAGLAAVLALGISSAGVASFPPDVASTSPELPPFRVKVQL